MLTAGLTAVPVTRLAQLADAWRSPGPFWKPRTDLPSWMSVLKPSSLLAERDTSAKRTLSMTCCPPDDLQEVEHLAVGRHQVGDLLGDLEVGHAALEHDGVPLAPVGVDLGVGEIPS